MKRRVWAFMLSLAMFITLCPTSVFAVEAEEVETVVAEEMVEEVALFNGLSEVEVSGEMTIEAARAGASTDMEGLVIKGVGENATLIVEGTGGGLSNIHLENVTVVDNTFYTYENGENAWEFTYLELEGTCTFKNVTFTDGVMFDGNITATDCTFMGHANDSSEYGDGKMYGAWVHNGSATFENCQFTGTRGLKMHEAYGSDIATVTVTNCTFDSLTEKPGIAIGNLDAVVEVTDSKFINCDIYETDTMALTTKNSTVVFSGEYTLTAANAGKVTDMNGLTLVGADENATLIVEGNGGGLSNINLRNLSVVDNTFYTSQNGENAWEFTYLEFEGDCAFENVTFTDGVMFEGDIKATDCKFIGHNNDSSEHGNITMYGAWVSNGTAAFDNCEFTGTRGLKVHEAYGSDVTSTTVKDCKFNNLTEKPGVVIGTLEPTTVVDVVNCEFIGCEAFETDTIAPAFDNSAYIVEGEYTLTAANAGKVTDMNGLTFRGADENAKLVIVGNGGGLSNINLENLTVVDNTFYTSENGENAWEFTYLEFEGDCAFENVTFTDGVMFEGNITATDCTFVGHNNDSSEYGNITMYGAWVQNGKAALKNCTFTGNRGLKVHEAYGSNVTSVTVEGCTFDSLVEKPGIAFGTLDASTAVTVSECEFINCLQYETDTEKFNLKMKDCAATIDVATAEELAEALAATNPVLTGDYTINITADIDLKDVTLTSGYLNGYKGAKTYTVNGNGHKITNLTTPLFSGTWAGKGKLYINDLTIADSGIVGGKDSVGCGAFVGNASATEMVQLKNCHLVDSSVLGADWTGGLVGYAAGYSNQNDGPVFEYVVMEGCSVENCTIIGAGSTGAVIGHATGDKWTDVTINNCVVKNNIVKCTDDSNVKAGAVLGTVGVGTVHVNATVSGNSVTSNGNAVNRIFGRIGSTGGVLDITGGSYSDYWKEDTTKAPEGDSAKEYTINVAEGVTFKVVVPPTPVAPSEPEDTDTPDEPATTPVTTPAQTTTTTTTTTTPSTPVEEEEVVEIEDEETPLASGEIRVEVVVKEEVIAKAEEQVNTLVEQILAGETVEETVVSEETVSKIMEAIENGEEIVAKVVAETIDEKEIPAEAKEAVKEAVAAMVEPEVTNVVVAQFLDLSVAICTGSGEELGTYNELNETLTFTVAIPDDMETEGKTFVVIRVHNGEVTILDTVMNEDGTLSFETDRFSTYALAYKEDVVKETVEDTEVADKEIVDEETPLVESSNGNFFLGAILLAAVVIIAAVGLVLVKKSVGKAE